MKTKTIIKIIVWIIVLGAAGYGIKYSLDAFEKGQAALGIVICDETECQKSMHIHSDVIFDLCETGSISLPRETGPLNGLHTHKERNYLHFHDSIPLNYETREDEYDKRLTIQEIIDVFELDMDKYCDMSRNPQVSVFVNDEIPADGLQYNWVDGDEILIRYAY